MKDLEQQKDPKLLQQQIQPESRFWRWTEEEENEEKAYGEHKGEVQKVQRMEGLQKPDGKTLQPQGLHNGKAVGEGLQCPPPEDGIERERLLRHIKARGVHSTQFLLPQDAALSVHLLPKGCDCHRQTA